MKHREERITAVARLEAVKKIKRDIGMRPLGITAEQMFDAEIDELEDELKTLDGQEG